MESIISVKNLHKAYGQKEAVRGIDFEVNAGEIFSLIGPNGAGKSTTLRMIATILSPTGGTIEVAGFDVAKQPDKVRQVISYLPEEAGAYKNLKAIDYLNFMATLYAPNKATQKHYVDFAKQITGLGARLNDKISTYSKGMTRKLLLARTVMSRPHLAILDEPTSGLDIINAFEIRSIIKDLSKSGMAVLLSSHNMLEIEMLSHRVAIIDNGKILETGEPEELKNKHHAKNLEEVFMAVTKDRT